MGGHESVFGVLCGGLVDSQINHRRVGVYRGSGVGSAVAQCVCGFAGLFTTPGDGGARVSVVTERMLPNSREASSSPASATRGAV